MKRRIKILLRPHKKKLNTAKHNAIMDQISNHFGEVFEHIPLFMDAMKMTRDLLRK